MKLRITGNSIRLRLKPSEVAQLGDLGMVEDRLDFGAGPGLAYRLTASAEIASVQAGFDGGCIEIVVPQTAARQWAGSNDVALAGLQDSLAILIEKDFRCMHQDASATDVYPNPQLVDSGAECN